MPEKYRTTGIIEKCDDLLDEIIDATAIAEIIAEGMIWSEGPVWIEQHNMLLFSDVPANIIYKWTEEKGKEVYLTPSGYTGTIPRGGEMGSNGLTLDNEGRLVLCQCGDRQMGRMDASFSNPAPKYISLASHFEGKRFNSPNDTVYNSQGELFFTDPPYGLEKQMDDPAKEISFQGIYKVSTDGTVQLLTDKLTRPNGLAFFPDETTLLVSNSDPDVPEWYAFVKNAKDEYVFDRLFYSMVGYDKDLKGLPDGLKIDSNGNVFATAPGGVMIINNKGKLVGSIKLEEATSNIAITPDEKTLFITNHMQVLRFKMRN